MNHYKFTKSYHLGPQKKKKNIAKKVCQSLVTGWTLIQELKIWDDLSIKNTEKIGLNYLTIKNRN